MVVFPNRGTDYAEKKVVFKRQVNYRIGRLDEQANYYVTDFPHSSIDYKTSCGFKQVESSKNL
ncbi:MAG: hypothetical protein ABSG22_07430 [Sedimentisphaerales bacterium]|jgi:hypothetical protein